MTKIINRVLAVALIAAIFIIGGVTLATNFKSFAYAFLVNYTQYADKGAKGLDTLKPRITALNTVVNAKLVGKADFEKLNARFQLALGKQMLSFGGTTMVRLKGGQLYDVEADVDHEAFAKEIDKMVALNGVLTKKGVPLVFTYAHSELYEDGLLPTGVRDFNNKVADEIIERLRAGGVTTIDSRELYNEKGFTMADAAMNTDQHWAIPMAFAAYKASLDALNATGKIALDDRAADLNNFDTVVYEKAHMGDVGARVGASSVVPDDFPVITPKFETAISSRVKQANNKWQERSGSFQEAVLNMDVLEKGELPHSVYDTYGYHTDLAYYTNENAPEGRLLIVKDSFGTPVASFMSLAVSEVCTMDLRRTRKTVEQMVEEFKPDAVLVVHCQEMMRGEKNYAFVD